MARSERQDDVTRGGVGTISRQGKRSRPDQAPDVALSRGARHQAGRRRAPPGPCAPAGAAAARGDRPAAAGAGRRAEPGAGPAHRRPAGPACPGPGDRQATGRRAACATPRRCPATAAAPPRQAARGRHGQRGPGAAGHGPGRRRAGPAGPPAAGAPWRVPPTRRPAQTAGPGQPGGQALPGTAVTAVAPSGSHRMPFVLLLCGLLGGALISALVISTTLAEGSFQISKLQDSTSALARQRQALQEQVAQKQSAQTIAQGGHQAGHAPGARAAVPRPDHRQDLQ